MPETKHDPEPWTVKPVHSNGCEVGPEIMAGDEWVATLVGAPYLGSTTTNPNAARIVAAVNSVAGIPTAALEAGVVAELVAACQAFSDQWDAYMADDTQLYPDRLVGVLRPLVAAVLAKVKGE